MMPCCRCSKSSSRDRTQRAGLCCTNQACSCASAIDDLSALRSCAQLRSISDPRTTAPTHAWLSAEFASPCPSQCPQRLMRDP
eukprot:3209719-Rhodomonas_salina.2